MRKGWYNESMRHSLASRGIFTSKKKRREEVEGRIASEKTKERTIRKTKEFVERTEYQRMLGYKFDVLMYDLENTMRGNVTFTDISRILGEIDDIEIANNDGPYSPNIRDHYTMRQLYEIKSSIEEWDNSNVWKNEVLMLLNNLRENETIMYLGKNPTNVNPLTGGFY